MAHHWNIKCFAWKQTPNKSKTKHTSLGKRCWGQKYSFQKTFIWESGTSSTSKIWKGRVIWRHSGWWWYSTLSPALASLLCSNFSSRICRCALAVAWRKTADREEHVKELSGKRRIKCLLFSTSPIPFWTVNLLVPIFIGWFSLSRLQKYKVQLQRNK